MDFSFLTFSPPKRNSRVPQLGGKRKKSKSPVMPPQNLQAVCTTSVVQKMTNNLGTSGHWPHSKHTSRGKENREKLTGKNFSNRLASKLCPPIKSIGKKVLFKPCRRINCSPPTKHLTSDLRIVISDSRADASGASSEGKQAIVEAYSQQDSLVNSSVEIIDEDVVVLDTSCAVGDIREALKLISVSEKRNDTVDSSVCIVSESACSSASKMKVHQSEATDSVAGKHLAADSSNIVPNTSSSGSSDVKTPVTFSARRNNNVFCTFPRTKGHKTRNIPRELENVLVGNNLNVGTSDGIRSTMAGRKANADIDSSLNCTFEENKCISVKQQSENMRLKSKSRPLKPYKVLQNSLRQCLLREVLDGGSERGLGGQNSKFLVERNVQSYVPDKLCTGETIPLSNCDIANIHSSSCNENVDNQSGVEAHSPLAMSTPVLSSSKYREIENWLNAHDFSKASPSLPDSGTDHSCSKAVSVNTPSNKNDDFLSVSAVEILNTLYGDKWCSADIHKKCYTEPPQRHKHHGEFETSQIKCVKPNGQAKRSSSPSSGEEDNLSEFLKSIYCSRKPNKQTRQLLHTPDFIDDGSIEDSPTQYLRIQSKDVRTEVKKTCQTLKDSGASSNSEREDGVRQFLDFASSKSGSSDKSMPICTKKMPKEVKRNKKEMKRNKKELTVKSVELRKPVEVNTLVRKESKICTRRASLHIQPTLSFLASLSAPTPNGKCDSEARYFKKNFSKLKEELGKKLFHLYNEKVFENRLPHDMQLQWNVRMKQTAGYCYSKRTLSSTGEKIQTSRIVLSTKVIATPDRLRDTLIHEMCHAAAWILDMVKDGHGPRWKAWAKKAMTVFPELPPIRRCHDYNIHTKFTYRCVGCGYSFGRHSKSLNLTVKRCGYCFGEFELLVNTKNKAGVVVQTPKLYRSPRGFARFVKENYTTVKKAQPSLKHGDVMKLLSEQFKSKHKNSSS